jgi:cell division protein FtsB
MAGLRLYLLGAVLLGTLLFLQYRLWFEPSGIHHLLQMKQALRLQTEENEKLKKHNEGLLFQIQRLQKSQDASESRARNELGMIKKGETFYQIVRERDGQ